MNIRLPIEIRHLILIKCHVNNIEVKKFNYIPKIEFLTKSSPKSLGAPTVVFEGMCVQMMPRSPAG